MGIRPNHCQFQGAPCMTLLHLHHHHHHLDPLYSRTIRFHLHHPHHYLDPLYSRTIQFHLHHHHWFNQPHRLELLFYMVRLRPRHILLWPLHRLLITLRPVSIGLSRGSGLCMFLMELDECLKHSSYTRVGSSFSHFFHSTSIVFMDKYLILSLV